MNMHDEVNRMQQDKQRTTPRADGCRDIRGGRRCAITAANGLNDGNEPDGWWVGYSPRNGYGASVEGSWDDWVTLAKAILAEQERRTAAASPDAGAGGGA